MIIWGEAGTEPQGLAGGGPQGLELRESWWELGEHAGRGLGAAGRGQQQGGGGEPRGFWSQVREE